MFLIPDSIKVKAHHYFLNKQLNELRVSRKACNFAQAKSIAILFNATDIANHPAILNYRKELETDKKKVKILGYIDTSRKDNFLSFDYFSNSHLNWHKKPVGHVIDDFIQTPFDILINAYHNEALPLRYISLLSKAKFRIGIYNQTKIDINDVMINFEEQMDLETVLKEMDSFLRNLKTNGA